MVLTLDPADAQPEPLVPPRTSPILFVSTTSTRRRFIPTTPSLSRGVPGVAVVDLHGLPQQLATVQDAIDYLKEYADAQPSPAHALKYAVDARYNNGDIIHGVFEDKAEAILFLETFA